MKYNTTQARHAVLRERQVRLINARALRFAALFACAAALPLAEPAEGSTILYVAKDNDGAAEPYDKWETAAADIKTAAIYATNLVATSAADSVEILVARGKYTSDNNIYLCAGVTLRGATGDRDDVVIGQSAYTSKTTKRIIRATGENAVIADLTVTGGYVYAHAGNKQYDYGGGVLLTAGAMITNCHITACTGHYGGAAAGMRVKDSYAYDVLVDKCTTKPWKADTPIQTKGYAVLVDGKSVVDRCQIVDNKATGTKFSGNYYGGALCVFNDTSTTYADSCIVRNSMIARNSVAYTNSSGNWLGIGASIKGGIIENCTIVSNVADVAGCSAGVVVFKDDNSTVRNCHISDNFCGADSKNYGVHDASTSHYRRFQYCCTSPLHDNLTSCVLDDDGTWEFDKKGDFRLLKGSPCIDAASQQTWMTGAIDLYGNDRKLYGKADIGAVEYVKSGGFIVVVR